MRSGGSDLRCWSAFSLSVKVAAALLFWLEKYDTIPVQAASIRKANFGRPGIKANPSRIRSLHLKDWSPDQARGFKVLFGEFEGRDDADIGFAGGQPISALRGNAELQIE